MIKPVRAEITAPLLDWYDRNKRTLPWRGTKNPYEVWVSEIMLQQTRVETVKPYFTRWMSVLPTVFDLAQASEETVLKLWEGLGYYSRVKNLQKAAKIIVKERNGIFPDNAKGWQTLPGIGAYTAGAVLSIAFGQKEPAVDGNVLRVISRLDADPFDITKNDVRKEIADSLRPLMPDGKTSDFTQALFEIGALICLPDDEYRCEHCPLSRLCEANRTGTQSQFPVKPKKSEKKEHFLTVFVLCHQGKYALRKRPDKGLLASLYELPNIEKTCTPEEASALFQGDITPLPPSKHVFTHLIWNMQGYLIKLNSLPQDKDLVFVTPEEITSSYPLPSAFSAYKPFLV